MFTNQTLLTLVLIILAGVACGYHEHDMVVGICVGLILGALRL